jgi:hypothetical protein
MLNYLDLKDLPKAIEVMERIAPSRILSIYRSGRGWMNVAAFLPSIKGVRTEDITFDGHTWTFAWW